MDKKNVFPLSEAAKKYTAASSESDQPKGGHEVNETKALMIAVLEKMELFDALLVRMDVFDAKLEGLQTEMREGFRRVDERFEQVDKRFENVEQEIAVIKDTMATKEEVRALERGYRRLESLIDVQSIRTTELEARVRDLAKEVYEQNKNL